LSFRVVFDTNVIVSALLFSKSSLAWLRESWSKRICTPIVSTETTKELLRVLTYPKFQLTREEQIELLGEFLPFVETEMKKEDINLEIPICRDKHDQIFLTLAHTTKADFLVTGDSDLLVLNEQVDLSIMTPSEFKNYTTQVSGSKIGT